MQEVIEQREQGEDGGTDPGEKEGRHVTVEDRFLGGSGFSVLGRFDLTSACPLPEAVYADGYIVYVQSHIRVYLRKEEDKDIDEGSEETYHPHGPVLPDLQEQIKQPGQYSEIFQ
jgi:hypothetical protein